MYEVVGVGSVVQSKGVVGVGSVVQSKGGSRCRRYGAE